MGQASTALKEIIAIWSELTGYSEEEIDIGASLLSSFDDSFSIMMFCLRLGERFDREVTLVQLLDHQNVESLAEWLCTS